MVDQTHVLTSPSPTGCGLCECSIVADIRRAIQQGDLEAVEQLLRRHDDAQPGSVVSEADSSRKAGDALTKELEHE